MRQKAKIQAFLNSLEKKHLSNNTVKAYEDAIMRFYRYFDNLSPNNLLLYQNQLMEEFRPQTVNLSIIGMNKFLTYLGKPDWRLPTHKIQQCRFLENVISNNEYQQMLDYTKQKHALKYYYLLRALATTGVRVSELKKFRVEQEGCAAGTSLTKNDVVTYLKDVYGKYELLNDYRSLWQYSNSYVYDETEAALASGKGHHYDFIADMNRDECFDMPGMGNGNKEELFGIQFMNASSWGINGAVENGGTYSTARMYCNYLSVFWALRVNGTNGDRDHTYPFTQGWGQGGVSCNIWDDWTIAEANNGNPYTDKRKLGSLIDGVTANKEIDYDFVKDCCEASGYGVKKYNGVTLDACTGDTPWWNYAGGETFKGTLENPMQGEHFEDYYLMRYADVLLMLTELTGDATYMNEVQARAGVPQTAYSLKAVQDERRWEFAFEGLRFNDMRRWTGKDVKGGYASKALDAQSGKLMYCNGKNQKKMEHMTSSWHERYEATNGFLSKPQAQITLMNGKLEQNPGWDAADQSTQYKALY